MNAQVNMVLGQWKTIDDETGVAKSIVEVYEKEGKVFGKIIDILNPADKDKICIYCKGDEKNQPLIGLNIIKGLQLDGDRYEDGTIFDPEKGKEYNAKIWVENDTPNTLMVRGYIAFLYRTQEWIRVE
tara:strand:+ start:32708 stop:33091 length:384 start_codon:yes stop_codon:yes gene_type:complete